MNAKCLKIKRKQQDFCLKNDFKLTYFLLRLFSHHVHHQMLENNFQFQHQLSKISNKKKIEFKGKSYFTSRGKFFINKRLAINWLCRGIFASFNLFIKLICSWLGVLLPVDWFISIWQKKEEEEEEVEEKKNRIMINKFDLI